MQTMQNIKQERLLSINELKAALGGANYEDHILFTRIDSSNVNKFNDVVEDMFLTRSIANVVCNIFVVSGEIVATLDYRKYTAGPHTVLGLLPFKVLTQLAASANAKAYMLVYTNDFIASGLPSNKPLPVSHILSAKHTPLFELGQKDYETLKASLMRIEHYLKDSGHLFRKEIITNAIYNLMLESANIYLKENTPDTAQPNSSIKEAYIKRFIEEMVKYGDKEHNPAFYANKLCISVQYLSLILKEVSGKTANSWIARYLITRAKVMLRKPDSTIQQVAETLNFSDQSSFGKFFKKHVGISPKRYQEENTIF